MEPTVRARSIEASSRAWSGLTAWCRALTGMGGSRTRPFDLKTRDNDVKSRLIERMDAPDETANFTAMCRAALADEALLRRMLSEADTVPQALIHAQLTGDESVLQRAAPFIEGGWGHMERIPEALRK